MSFDLYQIVTDKIVAQLESGVSPWVKPWSNSGHGGLPFNCITGKPYRGINTMLLWAPAQSEGEGWLTFKQAQEVGANVRKGEKGSMIVFFKPLLVKDKNSDEGKEKSVPMLKHFTVFHSSQVENLPEKYLPVAIAVPTERQKIDAAELLLQQATINHGGDRAYYRIDTDAITLPHQQQFKSVDDYYATALHELTHWTGAKHRLARDFNNRFGDSGYAREELVAEMGAAFLCARTGIAGQLQHASYIQSWLKVLKHDKRAVFVASSAAQKAADFILGSKQAVEQQDEQLAA